MVSLENIVCIIYCFRIPFEEKEKIKLKQQEIEEVQDLDNWRPSDPLIPTLQIEIVK